MCPCLNWHITPFAHLCSLSLSSATQEADGSSLHFHISFSLFLSLFISLPSSPFASLADPSQKLHSRLEEVHLQLQLDHLPFIIHWGFKPSPPNRPQTGERWHESVIPTTNRKLATMCHPRIFTAFQNHAWLTACRVSQHDTTAVSTTSMLVSQRKVRTHAFIFLWVCATGFCLEWGPKTLKCLHQSGVPLKWHPSVGFLQNIPWIVINTQRHPLQHFDSSTGTGPTTSLENKKRMIQHAEWE